MFHLRFSSSYVVLCVKGACSDPQPHPPNFFKPMEILVPEVDLYLEGFMCEL